MNKKIPDSASGGFLFISYPIMLAIPFSRDVFEICPIFLPAISPLFEIKNVVGIDEML